ncbi:MAG TPA: 50S ribosomal protein L11 methyltransferase [Thermoanaerobacterales bacterium]|nr:50S ribosomal protein L11 methyltransferase [Thermoanaerobacterales bacterium]
MNWAEIRIKTSTEAVEAVSNIFYEAGVAGVVIEDPKDFMFQKKGDWDYFDMPGALDFEEAIVTGYLVEDSSLAERTQQIKKSLMQLPSFGLNIGKGEITIENVSEVDWANAWKKYYKPTRIGKNLVIKPSWEKYNQKPDDIIIELDPGMAFGTGTHETTRLCLEAIEKYLKKGCSVIDIGCGSGILSIACGKLGAEKVIALDKDEVAVRVAQENIKRNNLSSIIKVIKGDSLSTQIGKADIIVANIIADVIIDLCPNVPFNLNEGGIFISSGIIKDRELSVIEALERNGFDIIEKKQDGEWITIISKQALNDD